MRHIEKWSVNESLLQSYRAIFISSQSFLLAVGIYAIQWNIWVFIASFFTALVVIFWMWKPIVLARSYIVDFHKYQIDSNKKNGYSEDDYVHSKNIRENINRNLGIKKNNRETRHKVDVWLPRLFVFNWLAILFSYWY